MNKTKLFLVASVITLPILSFTPSAFSSGAFVPGGGGPPDKNYNLGKSIVKGKGYSGESCNSCHKSFKRGALKKVGSPIASFISSCDSHTPCYKEKLTSMQAKAVNAYFAKRYNLR